MKLQKVEQDFQFASRRTRPPEKPGPSVQSTLFAENPWISRGIDLSHVAVEMVEPGLPAPLARGASGLVALSAGIWGASKLVQSQTALDRIDAVGTLALATEAGMTAFGVSSHLALPCCLLHGASEIIVGGADMLRATRESSRRRMGVGLCQAGVGAAMLAASCLPAASPFLLAGALGGQLTRQVLLGFKNPGDSAPPPGC